LDGSSPAPTPLADTLDSTFDIAHHGVAAPVKVPHRMKDTA
jgi:hypothetical protein